MEFHHDNSSSPSFGRKLKTSIFCASSCCNYDEYDDVESMALEPSHHNNNFNKLMMNLLAWIKSELPEIKSRLFSGKITRNRHRANSDEFRYDPLSYALNFEDDNSRFDDDHYPLRNFSSRLPPSPSPEKKNVVVSRHVAAFS